MPKCGDHGQPVIKDHAGWTLKIVKRDTPEFAIIGLNWIVERTFAWLGRERRLSKDYEAKVQTSEDNYRNSRLQALPQAFGEVSDFSHTL